ncbi:hypothetical protein [Herbaspirillum sp. RV1423]|uniref:hypothetical protein n=1 Tax=Herbaspirillum sp. RV1423 TaxID=1443993 RepID=UPI0012DBCB6D|nr:hypothetical protein [Herbaspirillum sp. RV1423]
MNKIDRYVQAGTRDNTRIGYQSALRHYEVEWGGFLPATADNIAQYLADHAETLAINTLRQRLAAIAQWHLDQGFPDPTKAPLVRKVFRGIQAEHPAQEKRAKPFQLGQLSQVDAWLETAITAAQTAKDRAGELRHTRDRALLLLGFWRGFRGDELARLQAEYVEVVQGEGMICFLPRSKGDRHLRGVTFKAPALSRLCPVTRAPSFFGMRCFWSGRHRLRAVLAAPRRQYAAVSCPRWPGSTSTGPDITFEGRARRLMRKISAAADFKNR